MEAEKARLAKNDFKYREFRLGPPPPPKPPQVKKTDDSDDPDEDLDTDESDTYVPLDIPLRESLRIVNDALKLSQDPQLRASDHAPLTAIVDDKS
jgi:carboxyl-terminal processing protease